MERPWFKAFPRDWLSDQELMKCSTHARAVLFELMCQAHEGVPYGYLSTETGPLSESWMASRSHISIQKFREALKELKHYNRVQEDDNGALLIRRMVRDEELRTKRAAGGSLSLKHPHVLQRKDTLPDTLEDIHDLKMEGVLPHVRGRALTSDSVLLTTTTSESKSNTSNLGENSLESVHDEQFQIFIAEYEKSCKPLILEDFQEAYYPWKLLDFEQKAQAINGVRERISLGVWVDPGYIPSPKNYISKREFKRKVTPKSSPAKTESFVERMAKFG